MQAGDELVEDVGLFTCCFHECEAHGGQADCEWYCGYTAAGSEVGDEGVLWEFACEEGDERERVVDMFVPGFGGVGDRGEVDVFVCFEQEGEEVGELVEVSLVELDAELIGAALCKARGRGDGVDVFWELGRS